VSVFFSFFPVRSMQRSYGIKSFVLFPKISESLKSNYAEESYNPNGLIPRAIAMIKDKCPDAVIVTDVALDPYSSQVRYCMCTFISHDCSNVFVAIGS
jgi:delta-aminolevulinic acid dehydratase/porphobilinogen synthase